MATALLVFLLLYSLEASATDKVIYVACYSPCFVYLDDRLVLYYKMQSIYDTIIPGKINVTESFETLVILIESGSEQYGFYVKSEAEGYYNSFALNWRCMSLPAKYPGQVANIEELAEIQDDQKFIYVNTLVDATEFMKSTFLDLSKELTNAWKSPEDCLETTDIFKKVHQMTAKETWLSTSCSWGHKKPEPPQDNSTKGQSHLLSKQLLCTCLNRKAQEAPRFLSLFENLALVLSILLILLLFLYTLWKNFFFSVLTLEPLEYVEQKNEKMDAEVEEEENYRYFYEDVKLKLKKKDDAEMEEEEMKMDKEVKPVKRLSRSLKQKKGEEAKKEKKEKKEKKGNEEKKKKEEKKVKEEKAGKQ